MSGQPHGHCEFSPCRQWRYTLWRQWGWEARTDFFSPEKKRSERAGSYLMVIGLNPSTADEKKDDPTIRRCISFAKGWGFGGLCMTNLFAWRDTKPENMMAAADPVGPENDRWLEETAKGAGMILAAWGVDGCFKRREDTVVRCIPAVSGKAVHCLGTTKNGAPRHPLYVKGDTQPVVLLPA